MQERCNSIANALELRLSCTNLTIGYMKCQFLGQLNPTSRFRGQLKIVPVLPLSPRGELISNTINIQARELDYHPKLGI